MHWDCPNTIWWWKVIFTYANGLSIDEFKKIILFHLTGLCITINNGAASIFNSTFFSNFSNKSVLFWISCWLLWIIVISLWYPITFYDFLYLYYDILLVIMIFYYFLNHLINFYDFLWLFVYVLWLPLWNSFITSQIFGRVELWRKEERAHDNFEEWFCTGKKTLMHNFLMPS